MSIKSLPDYSLKQKILYIDKPNETVLRNYGNLFFEEGFLSDSLEFYQKAKDKVNIQKIRDIAYDTGDVMLFQQASKALGLEPKSAEWEGIGQKAIILKKYSFARHALEKAGNEEMINSLKKIMQQEVDSKRA